MDDSVMNGDKRHKNGAGTDKERDKRGRWASGNPGRKKGSKDKFTTLKNECVKVFEQHGGPARLAELMAKSPEKYFEFLVRLQPREIVADVTTSHQPTIAAPPEAPESLSTWIDRRDEIVEALPQDTGVEALLESEVGANGNGSN